MTHTLTLRGRIPAKKNRRQARMNRWGQFLGLRLSDADRADLEALGWQCRQQWGNKKPLSRAAVSATFHGLSVRADLDNAYTALQDVLVACRVLTNDTRATVQQFAVSHEDRMLEPGVLVTIDDFDDEGEPQETKGA